MKEKKEGSHWIRVAEIIDNDDGSANVTFEFSDDFKEWFKKVEGLKRWSDKRFQKVILKSLTDYVAEVKQESKPEPTSTE
tara:strand:- start:265 stop:504 length:240 start_codon:yes stop_codon:yes gene_type:complete